MSNTTTAKSSGLTGSGTNVILNRPSRLNSVLLVGDAAIASTIVIYDNTAASGTVLAFLQAPPNGSAIVSFNNPVRAEIGITVVVAGGSANAVISYDA